MLHFMNGDLLKQDAEALVNTVNSVGIMGRGIALQFRNAFPENYKAYVVACEHGQVQPGRMFVFETGSLYNPRYIINFPTKRHWKGKSRMEDIQSGLKALIEEIRQRHIKSIALPPLGAGLGGLDWLDVKQEILKALQNIPNVEIYVFEPTGAPEAENMVKSSKVPNMTEGRAALLGLMRRYLSAVMDPTVTLLELQKLMYFMQESGEPLQLIYSKGAYGPYARNLAHVLKAIEGYFISGYLDGGDDPTKPLQIKPEIAEKAEAFLSGHEMTQSRFDRVTELIEGFETPYGMELLSTVHWVSTRESATSLNDVVNKVHAWSVHKKMFPEKHIRVALDVLYHQGWLNQAQ